MTMLPFISLKHSLMTLQMIVWWDSGKDKVNAELVSELLLLQKQVAKQDSFHPQTIITPRKTDTTWKINISLKQNIRIVEDSGQLLDLSVLLIMTKIPGRGRRGESTPLLRTFGVTVKVLREDTYSRYQRTGFWVPAPLPFWSYF